MPKQSLMIDGVIELRPECKYILIVPAAQIKEWRETLDESDVSHQILLAEAGQVLEGLSAPLTSSVEDFDLGPSTRELMDQVRSAAG